MTDTRRTPRGHLHAEAFCLMTYASRDFEYCERIWNSRDGVTPFIIRSRDGLVEMQHVQWDQDTYLPDHKPQPGDRIFVDLGPEVAAERAQQMIDRYWDDPEIPMSKAYASKEDALARLSRFDPGTPMTVVVPGGGMRGDAAEQRGRGLYEKYYVERRDGRDRPGGDRTGAEYLVLDLTYNPHAAAAVRAYADAVRAEYPLLAADLDAKLAGMEANRG